jgi:hypothetical protein
MPYLAWNHFRPSGTRRCSAQSPPANFISQKTAIKSTKTIMQGSHVCRRVGRRIQVDSHTCWGRDRFPCSQECTRLQNQINNREESNKYCMSGLSSLHRMCMCQEHSSTTRASSLRGRWLRIEVNTARNRSPESQRGPCHPASQRQTSGLTQSPRTH